MMYGWGPLPDFRDFEMDGCGEARRLRFPYKDEQGANLLITQ